MNPHMTFEDRMQQRKMNSLIDPLPNQEAEVMRSLLGLYSGVVADKTWDAVRKLDVLASGFPTPSSQPPTRKLVKWRRNLQKHISQIAHPRIGRDRQAIALACFRDYVMSNDPDIRRENLDECRYQLMDLYSTLVYSDRIEW